MHILLHDENGRRHIGVRDLDMSELAIANLGFEPNAQTRARMFVTCDQIADPNPQGMQVKFVSNVYIRTIDQPDRYEQMSIDNHVDDLLTE